MIYLKSFNLLSEEWEFSILEEDKRRIYNNQYPLRIFPDKKLEEITFDPITIFYGGNGSGKTTLLNIIACKLNALRKSTFNKGNYFELYTKRCSYNTAIELPEEIKYISSDDVFDYLLDIRAINANVNRRKNELSQEWLLTKYSNNVDLNDYENLKKHVDVNKHSMSYYVRERLSNNNIIEQSNGESALMFWEQEITENSIYILDEPENSLSAENQLKLKKFIEESVRFYNCQFIISTHSPFLLGLSCAKIYDLDEVPVSVKEWTKLPNVRLYYNFFKDKYEEFKTED